MTGEIGSGYPLWVLPESFKIPYLAPAVPKKLGHGCKIEKRGSLPEGRRSPCPGRK